MAGVRGGYTVGCRGGVNTVNRRGLGGAEAAIAVNRHPIFCTVNFTPGYVSRFGVVRVEWHVFRRPGS